MEIRERPAVPPMLVIRDGDVYSPDPLGRQDILVAGGQVVAIGRALPAIAGAKEISAAGLRVLPGFIDGHVHLLGGGGEGGPATRNPDLGLSHITGAGVTTVIGLLGFDCLTRTVDALLAKARALTFEGITAYVLTGGYTVPAPTVTGTVMRDIALVEQIVGIGELALSDHRSSQPTLSEVAKIVAEARVGGLLGHKRGTVVLHVGDGKAGLSMLRDLVATTDLPAEQVLPTHTNRSEDLFLETIEYAKSGGTVDVTAGIGPHLGFPRAVKASEAVRRLLDGGVPIERITMSSDANGNMPVRDETGRVVRLDIQEVVHLFNEVRDLVNTERIPVEAAIRVVTSNPARVFALESKGRVAVGADADLALVDETMSLRSLYARGRLLVDDGQAVVRGTFEKL